MVLNILVYLTLFTLIISKFLDCIITYRGLKQSLPEKNIIANFFIKRYGILNGIIIICLLSLLIILLAFFSIFISDGQYKILFILFGIPISIIQFLVSYRNYKIVNKINKNYFIDIKKKNYYILNSLIKQRGVEQFGSSSGS